MTGLFKGEGIPFEAKNYLDRYNEKKSKKRERRADKKLKAKGSKPYTGIDPPKAAVNPPASVRGLGPVRTPLSP